MREIDLAPGEAAQRTLIAERFAGLDTRRPLPAAERTGRTTVSAAWWGFDPQDATSQLQAALDSGAAVVLVPRLDAPWQCGELFVRSNTTLILEEGAELLAKKGSFLPPTCSLLNIIDVDDVTVRGYGAAVRMRKSEYTEAPYARGEWRHTLQICGGRRISVLGLTAERSGGDGVYLGRGSNRITNAEIVLKDLILRDHFRQGVSVITADGLLIENVEISRTSGTPPSAGIDFEPNLPDEPLKNCRLKNCLIRWNSGAGFQGYFQFMTGDSEPFDIVLERCTIYGNLAGVFVSGFDQGARGRISLLESRIHGLCFIPSVTGQLELVER